MNFTATTREVLNRLGLLDAKTLHRRRQDYFDKNNPVKPEHQVFQLGVHYAKKSPNSGVILWDMEKTLRAWKTATFALSVQTLQEKAADAVRNEMEGQS